MVQDGVGDLLLRGPVVLVGPVDLAVDDQDRGLQAARALGDRVHVDGLLRGAHPPGVQPQDVDLAVAGEELLDLVLRIGDEGLPFGFVGGDVVVVVAVRDRAGAVPVARVVPVRLREVHAGLHARAAEGVEDLADDVAPQARLLRRGLEVRVGGVVHGEAVVVLRGEDGVAHPRAGAGARPLCGVEVLAGEGARLVTVPRVVLGVRALPPLGGVREAAEPGAVQGPGPVLADVGEDPPVDDDPHLEVAPVLEGARGAGVVRVGVAGVLGSPQRPSGLEGVGGEFVGESVGHVRSLGIRRGEGGRAGPGRDVSAAGRGGHRSGRLGWTPGGPGPRFRTSGRRPRCPGRSTSG